MASDGHTPAHAGTYNSFLRWFTWGTIICAVLAAFVIWLIARARLRLVPRRTGRRHAPRLSGRASGGRPRSRAGRAEQISLAPPRALWGHGSDMIAPETFSHLELIKKRAGYLWRFL